MKNTVAINTDPSFGFQELKREIMHIFNMIKPAKFAGLNIKITYKMPASF